MYSSMIYGPCMIQQLFMNNYRIVDTIIYFRKAPEIFLTMKMTGKHSIIFLPRYENISISTCEYISVHNPPTEPFNHLKPLRSPTNLFPIHQPKGCGPASEESTQA